MSAWRTCQNAALSGDFTLHIHKVSAASVCPCRPLHIHTEHVGVDTGTFLSYSEYMNIMMKLAGLNEQSATWLLENSVCVFLPNM